MNAYYRAKDLLKQARWRGRRATAAIRWGPQRLAENPVVFGNAMPKSGSHLIHQVLMGLPRIGPFVDPGFPPVNRSEDNAKLPQEAVLRNIRRMRPGDIGYGYIHATPPFTGTLTEPGRATVFVYRDPRDTIVSHVFYATQMHTGHGMHRYYTEELGSMEERINAKIRGVDEPGYELSSVLASYQNYVGWLEQPGALAIRFEDLILNREESFNRLLDYLEERGFTRQPPRSEALRVLEECIQPQKSGTFRKGKPGNWREHFTPANIALFKECTGDLLVRLGYEESGDW